jgi:hypothetical protein
MVDNCNELTSAGGGRSNMAKEEFHVIFGLRVRRRSYFVMVN